MAIQYLAYNDNDMQSGVFYLVEANKDLAPNLRPINTILDPLHEATTNIVSIKAKNDAQDIEMNSIKETNTEIKENYLNIVQNIHDNTARINNLENIDLRTQFLMAMELASIKKNFTDTTEINIEYGRTEILAIRVNVLKESNDNQLIYQDSTSTVSIENIIDLDLNGHPIIKKIKIKSNQPITGYVLVL